MYLIFFIPTKHALRSIDTEAYDVYLVRFYWKDSL